MVSVIIPVYNVKNYVSDCIRSVVNQTYKDLEIIVVDDGSTDGSGEVCDILAGEDSRIQVIHKSNGGLSDARNTGIRRAIGEFILPVDSDDLIQRNCVSRLVNVCTELHAETAICTFSKVPEEAGLETAEEEMSAEGEIRSFSPSECLLGIYRSQFPGMSFTAWGKLYHRSLFLQNGIEYPVGKLHEDIFTTYQLLYRAEKIAYVPESLYLYRIRSGSIMEQKFDTRRLVLGDATRGQCNFFLKEEEEELYTLAVNNHIRTMFSLIACVRESLKGDERRMAEQDLDAQLRADCRQYLPLSSLSMARKALFRLAAWFPLNPVVQKLRMF